MRLNGPLSDIEFYGDPIDPTAIYAEFTVPDENYELFVHIDDERLKSYLRLFIEAKNDNDLSARELLQEAKDIFSLFGNSDKVSPKIRIAGTLKGGFIEYDLNNLERQYIQVTPEGWELTKKNKNKFLKKRTTSQQVIPIFSNDNLLTLLKPYVNCSSDDLVLFTAWLVQAFCEGNHSALLVMADKGCGKSTLTKMVKSIISPSTLTAGTMPQKVDDLLTILTNSYFVAFDNMDEINKTFSDIFCCAITGSSTSKRALYTTNELVSFTLHNTLIFNGIDIVPSESDLADRCLLLKLLRINEEKRKTDDSIVQKFNADLPKILGAIFTTLSKAMSIVETLTPKRLPRMADSYIEMLAIAIASGVTEEEFEKIYFDNLQALDKARSNIAIVQAVREYMTSKSVTGRAIEGTMTEIYRKICSNYSGIKSDLPKSASHFSRKLRSEYSALYSAGYTINIDDRPADGTHIQIIKNL